MKKNKKKLIYMVLIFCLNIILLTSCSCAFPGLGGSAQDNDIVIAGGNTTERQIVSEIVKQMIQHYLPESKVHIINNLGSTPIIYNSLINGDTNVAGVMYTGTSLTGELGMDPLGSAEETMEAVVKGYYERFDIVWFPSYGFENTYSFMLTKETKEKYNLNNTSDLEQYADVLRVGVDSAWLDRPGKDGYQGFLDVYGFGFDNLFSMDIGLVYEAIASDRLDIALGYSTDGRISSYDLVMLEDDRDLFPPYETSPVVTMDLLKQKPELEWILLKLQGQISLETMQDLNNAADELKTEPYKVAKNFLAENNFFEEVARSSLKEIPLYKDFDLDFEQD
ncbi:MAG TPA: osmoprotectant ABC transporter substrate-binding protein [Clostridiaceae bacterium]|nr:osmoprotectant ABC transporter substrate-binding protein [Clostridiaceae bacterium]